MENTCLYKVVYTHRLYYITCSLNQVTNGQNSADIFPIECNIETDHFNHTMNSEIELEKK